MVRLLAFQHALAEHPCRQAYTLTCVPGKEKCLKHSRSQYKCVACFAPGAGMWAVRGQEILDVSSNRRKPLLRKRAR
jgi:hypothetical protein